MTGSDNGTLAIRLDLHLKGGKQKSVLYWLFGKTEVVPPWGGTNQPSDLQAQISNPADFSMELQSLVPEQLIESAEITFYLKDAGPNVRALIKLSAP